MAPVQTIEPSRRTTWSQRPPYEPLPAEAGGVMSLGMRSGEKMLRRSGAFDRMSAMSALRIWAGCSRKSGI